MAGVTIHYKNNTIATMQSEGTKVLKTGGKYCDGDITVDYVPGGSAPSNCKTFTVTVSADQTVKYTLTAADADIAAHRADSSFFVGFIANFAYNSGLSYRGGLNTNHGLSNGSTYGYYMRTNSSGSNSFGFITKASTSGGAEIGTSASGEIFVYASSTLNLRAGTYTVFCGW